MDLDGGRVNQEEVLATLRAHGPMTTLEILERLGIPHSGREVAHCGARLRGLEKFDLVRVIGTTGPRHHRTNVWEAVE